MLRILCAAALALAALAAADRAVADDRYPALAERTIASYGEALARGRGVSLAGVVPELAAKARAIVQACGARVISARIGRERSRVRGSGRLSDHAAGRAIDMAGNPRCIYAQLRGWPGGVSTDYHRVRPPHVHFSYAPGGPEWGARFAHYTGKRKGKRRSQVGLARPAYRVKRKSAAADLRARLR